MSDYKAPIQDIHFLLYEAFGIDHFWSKQPQLNELIDKDTANAILEEGAKFLEQEVAPLNRKVDEYGAYWSDGKVYAPKDFTETYKAFCDGGWNALGGPTEFGGLGMPKTLTASIEEITQGASMAFGLIPMLTAGACLALKSHGSQSLQDKYLPHLYSGKWSGAMDLTEPHAGTDLGLIHTKAIKNQDNSYRITGNKIFITWGDHQLSENIVHLVLAKTPDAPAGAKGISLFLVPKFLVKDNGSLGEQNGVSCGSIEKKMGIKGSATCVMNFDCAQGWLIGEENQGLSCMFTMMNYERLAVGIQSLAVAERSYQNALTYARERRQGRSPSGAQSPNSAADSLLVHPDVRRMLLDMKVHTEGARALSIYIAKLLDIAKYEKDSHELHKANDLIALLTPVAKAFVSDKAFNTCVLGQQILGGHGYVREWGQEQLVRDVRITQIYEGANGIQAMDLLGRKVVNSNGELLNRFTEEVREFLKENGHKVAMNKLTRPLTKSISKLADSADKVMEGQKEDATMIGASANHFLNQFGLTALAYMWAKMAVSASESQNPYDDFYQGKINSAQYFFDQHLPYIDYHHTAISSAKQSVMRFNDNQF
ncbi:acyl-CoA dehydrogenase C-terminal domain-containing protein [uncultured Pseudoteredinibacter sp.]|uniref:acyl-CoA dehydrogenase C-terminal domain-containing protein n=1 Tax=uncultured Pseudoteredinibacter sp. TaxID=1641701 RepID=UPI0026112A73|nr:acyl-CoA dehydrogenase C-terminal domain-containing protein [uncultured Pseudoteredinibacter sp.]